MKLTLNTDEAGIQFYSFTCEHLLVLALCAENTTLSLGTYPAALMRHQVVNQDEFMGLSACQASWTTRVQVPTHVKAQGEKPSPSIALLPHTFA